MRAKSVTTTILRSVEGLADFLPRPARAGGGDSGPVDGPQAERFLLDLGAALHRYGTSAPRLEGALSAVAATLGVPIQPLSTPTSLSVCFGGGTSAPRTHILRVEPADVDLGRLASLDELLDDLADGRIDPSEGSRRLARLEAAPARYPAVLVLLAFGLASAAAARFFGGSGSDVLLSALLGTALGGLARIARRLETLARLFEPVAAGLVSAAAVLAAHHVPGTSDRLVTLAALIVLFPGFTLTVGLSELALRHQVSGTARLAAAGASFLSLGLGVALGRGLVGELPLPVAGTSLPAWTEWIALLVSPLAFAVLLSARRRDVTWVLLAGVLSYLGARQGALVLGPELGALVGALLVGLAGNLASHVLHRPPSVIAVPGLLLLVPGSMGFRSVSSFVSRDALGGLETAFAMAFVAAALVGGLLLANGLLPPRRAL